MCVETGKAKPAAWQDPADAQLQVDVASNARLRKLRSAKQQSSLKGDSYTAALRRQHAVLNPRTSWAALPSQNPSKHRQHRTGGINEDEPDEEAAARLLQHGVGGLLSKQRAVLAAGAIELSRLRDANQHGPNAAVVQCLEFHPNGQIMLTAGFDKKLRLFQVSLLTAISQKCTLALLFSTRWPCSFSYTGQLLCYVPHLTYKQHKTVQKQDSLNKPKVPDQRSSPLAAAQRPCSCC